MKSLTVTAVAVLLLLPGCRQPDEPPIEMRTIEDTRLPPIPTEPIQEMDPTAEPLPTATATDETEVDPAERERTRLASQDGTPVVLPFAPPIAMDPVDGSKITIHSKTPIVEHKGRLYYFGSEANRRAFLANPDQYLTGVLGRF